MKFQYIIVSFFGIMAVVGLTIFSVFPNKSKNASLAGAAGNVAIWGTYQKNDALTRMLQSFNDEYKGSFSVTYNYHDPKTFDNDIIEALASGRGPDILLLPDDLILRYTDKIEQIPYSMISQLAFQSAFVQAAEIYMRDTGLVAVPYAIDPIVMYWNRDIFNNASVTMPPKYWDEFLTLAPKLTVRDQKTQDITQSAIAFGEYANVTNAKDILTMLFLQTGDPIVVFQNGTPKLTFTKVEGTNVIPNADDVSALRFYMDFSNPLKNIYSWSRALPNSRDQFLKGGLAVYFDYVSAYRTLKEKNPHLNFAVAQVPMARNATVDISAAKIHGLAVMKSSRNKPTAFIAIQKLLEAKYSGAFSEAFSLPPVRRDLLNIRPADAVLSVSYDSAIRSRAWLDPRPGISDKLYQDTIEGISSGKMNFSDAISYLNSGLSSALDAYK